MFNIYSDYLVAAMTARYTLAIYIYYVPVLFTLFNIISLQYNTSELFFFRRDVSGANDL